VPVSANGSPLRRGLRAPARCIAGLSRGLPCSDGSLGRGANSGHASLHGSPDRALQKLAMSRFCCGAPLRGSGPAALYFRSPGTPAFTSRAVRSLRVVGLSSGSKGAARRSPERSEGCRASRAETWRGEQRGIERAMQRGRPTIRPCGSEPGTPAAADPKAGPRPAHAGVSQARRPPIRGARLRDPPRARAWLGSARRRKPSSGRRPSAAPRTSARG
jgi:hypothetical protein